MWNVNERLPCYTGMLCPWASRVLPGNPVAGHISGAQPMIQPLQPSDCRHVTQWSPARESKSFSLVLLPLGDG